MPDAPQERERCSGDLAAGLRVAFVLALFEAVTAARSLFHVIGVQICKFGIRDLRENGFDDDRSLVFGDGGPL
jgi:hypothetical protein